MTRTKIDYGIDLGTTNSAVARMESGEPVIRKTDTLKDTLPSCVGYNKKRSVQVGDAAFNSLRQDVLRALKSPSDDPNFFIEFKRTMGTDKTYRSSNMSRAFSSEELSSEILKKFRSLITDEEFSSAVITVPAKFTVNQKDATVRAANLAGFEHCELLQEPIAAAMAYGLGAVSEGGNWLVFDFGGGTFDAALMRVDEGIIKIVDTEGDNYLGGKNIDGAIVDEILIPHLAKNFALKSLTEGPAYQQFLRDTMKVFAENAKIQLSFNEHHNILSDLGDFPNDDDGVEIELDFTLTRDLLWSVEAPFFQRAIDISKDLLKRNGLMGDDLAALILVGGPTYSPNLRSMLSKQITSSVDTSIDPMTAVARGAALYASTLDIPAKITERSRDFSKVPLEVKYEPTSVETSELVTVKIGLSNDTSRVPHALFLEIERGGKDWSTGRIEIGDSGEVIDVPLEPGRANAFNVSLYDEIGNRVGCEPDQFTIIQGTKVGKATLSYHFGIEIKDTETGKLVFRKLDGLEKNRSYPALGVKTDLFTQKPISPASGGEMIKVPLYQGELRADGTRAIFSEHVYDAVVRTDDFPGFLPANSPVEITVKVHSDSEIRMSAFFPTLDHTREIEVPTGTTQTAHDAAWLGTEIVRARQSLQSLSDFGSHLDSSKLEELEATLTSVEKSLDQAPNDYDRRMQVRNNLRQVLKHVDELENKADWPATEERLKNSFRRLEDYLKRVEDDVDDSIRNRTQAAVRQFREQLPTVVKEGNKKVAKQLIEDMDHLHFVLTDAVLGVRMYIQFVHEYDEEFEIHEWSDRKKARLLINQGLAMAANNPTKDGLYDLLRELASLLPDSEKKTFKDDESLLVG